MTDAPQGRDRESIRRRAREMAIRRGFARKDPEPETAPDPAALPTENVFALRGLLHTNRLTPEQATAARRFLAEASAAARQADGTTPPDVQLPGGDAA